MRGNAREIVRIASRPAVVALWVRIQITICIKSITSGRDRFAAAILKRGYTEMLIIFGLLLVMEIVMGVTVVLKEAVKNV